MNATLVGLVAFGCAFGGTLIGMWLRTTLPEHHLDEDSRDTIKLGIGLIATMTALVLGLVTASAKNSFDDMDKAVKDTAIKILSLDRELARYGSETGDIRMGLQKTVVSRINMLWPKDSSVPPNFEPVLGSRPIGEALADSINMLKPIDEFHRRLQLRAIDLVESVIQQRWFMMTSIENSVPLPFLVILLFWLTLTFASFGLFAPRNTTVTVILFVCSMSIGSALFLILEMDAPFEGLLRVSPDPLRLAYSLLAQ